MARVTLSSDLRQFTGSVTEVEVAAGSYRELVAELCSRFPDLPEATVRKQSLAIDGMLVHAPMLETFGADSQLVFLTRIAGG